MKKIVSIVFALLLLSSGLFGDDALVLPARVGPIYLAPSFSFAMGSNDDEGEYIRFDDGTVQVFNLGFALEYGINRWITAAAQFAPGWTPWSNIEAASGFNNSNTNGFADIFAGAKLQLIGAQAPVKSEKLRFAIAPGVIIPLPGPDFKKEVNNALAGSDATLSNMDKHVFAAGARLYFDLIFNRNFFVNLHNETIFYPLAQDLNNAGPTFYAAKGAMAQTPAIQQQLGAGAPLIMDIDGEANYKYRMKFEVEPKFTTPIGEGISFTAGLPMTYTFSPAPEYSFGFPDAIASAAPALEPHMLSALATDPSHSLGVSPSVSLFLTNTPLPLEFKLNYSYPLWGRNTMATHTAAFQVRAYFAFGR